jgi:hypothetical protein
VRYRNNTVTTSARPHLLSLAVVDVALVLGAFAHLLRKKNNALPSAASAWVSLDGGGGAGDSRAFDGSDGP